MVTRIHGGLSDVVATSPKLNTFIVRLKHHIVRVTVANKLYASHIFDLKFCSNTL